MEINLTAGEDLNARSAADARPVQVRAYLMKQDERLRAATFAGVWQDDRGALGQDFLSVQEITVYPGASVAIRLTPPPEAAFVAVVALFREPEGAKWYLADALPGPSASGHCSKGAARLSMRITGMRLEEGTDQAARDPSP